MKSWIRTLSMLVCVALLMTMMPAGAYMEESLIAEEMVMEALDELRGSQAHSTVIISRADENTLTKLGINFTCEPRYETHRLYHG